MTFLNVVIGYGIIASVMTTDIDLSKEVVGLNFILWLIAVSALPLIATGAGPASPQRPAGPAQEAARNPAVRRRSSAARTPGAAVGRRAAGKA